jgi:GTP-binding protein
VTRALAPAALAFDRGVKQTTPPRAQRSRPRAAFAGSAADKPQFPKDRLPEVAFLGRSNVGKSSLLNALAGTRGLARVSSAPGRTRLVNFFRVEAVPKPGGRGRGDLYLVDLPGYGYAKAAREVRESFERIAVQYLVGREALRLGVFIVDARHDPGERDLLLRDFLLQHEVPWGLAANKVDAVPRGELASRLRALEAGLGRGAAFVQPVSAERGDGIEELWNRVRGAAFGPPAPAVHETRGHDGRF